jgi:hypothetical protein
VKADGGGHINLSTESYDLVKREDVLYATNSSDLVRWTGYTTPAHRRAANKK